MTLRRSLPKLVLILMQIGYLATAQAHSQIGSWMTIDSSDPDAAVLEVEVALLDVLQVLEVDFDADSNISWGEIVAARHSITGLISSAVDVTAGDTSCILQAAGHAFALVQRDGGPNLLVGFDVACPGSSDEYRLTSKLFQDVDPSHRTLFRAVGQGGDTAYLLSAQRPQVVAAATRPVMVRAFVAEGFRHILGGYDHLAFLLLLILPAAVKVGMNRRWRQVFAVVTAFTAAHSITLAAAYAGAVRLPVHPVEIAIAASVALAGLLNVIRPTHHIGWQVAFGFGLLHGFGFAAALTDLNLAPGALLASLVSFNAGVELGQLLIVVLALPPLVVLARWRRYRTALVPAASTAVGFLGLYWTAIRF